ncbi:NF-kappa-B inhibitor cactus [Gryllus bimaculatus]|nr:NF-kappa-B inhibitor cactus [Gryllus bimaculatus]
MEAAGSGLLRTTSGKYHAPAIALRATNQERQCLFEGDSRYLRGFFFVVEIWDGLGHVACVSALLEAGAAVDRCSPKGETPLHAAASWGRADCLEALLRAGADASARNRQGATALHLAVLSGQEDAIRVLLQVGGGEHSHDVDMDCEGRSDAEGDSDSEVDCEVVYPFIMESPLSV